MRTWLIKRLPVITTVTSMTDIQAFSYTQMGLAHRMLVCLDMMFGQLGSQIPDITISSRTALRCINPADAPMWALVLGVMLETPWAIPGISYRGHLQGAILADYARGRRAMIATSRPA